MGIDEHAVAVFDIDGVLADARHRLHHIAAPPKDWDAFFAAAPADPPLTTGVDLAAHYANDHRIVYLTGRPERCRADTLEWLAAHGLPEGELLMRRDDDRRPARFTKLRLLERLARDHTVAIVVDDDPLVCDAVRAAGFNVRQADWAHQDESEAGQVLHRAQETEGRS